MIEELKNTPNTMVGFRISGTINGKDFDSKVLTPVSELIGRTGKLNYLVITDQPENGDVFISWLNNTMKDLNTADKWNRGAIATDGTFYKTLSKTPGEFRTFNASRVTEAIDWVSEAKGHKNIQAFGEDGEQED